MESAYSELTHEERVVCFFRAGGHSWEEIGQRLGKSAAAVRMLHRRADERLQNELLAGDAF
jgi:DNA-directed RNA polymerase specialized sigma24 family protein